MNIIRPLLMCLVGVLLALPLESYAASKKVIIGFHRTPELHDHNLVYGAKGHIRRTHRRIAALAVEMPEEEVARLKKKPAVAYILDYIPVIPIQAIQTIASSTQYIDTMGEQ